VKGCSNFLISDTIPESDWNNSIKLENISAKTNDFLSRYKIWLLKTGNASVTHSTTSLLRISEYPNVILQKPNICPKQLPLQFPVINEKLFTLKFITTGNTLFLKILFAKSSCLCAHSKQILFYVLAMRKTCRFSRRQIFALQCFPS
jgi:hypothetical protein